MVILGPDGFILYVSAHDLATMARAAVADESGPISFWAPDDERYWLTKVSLVQPRTVRVEGTKAQALSSRRALRTSFTLDVDAPVPIIRHKKGITI